MTALRADHRVLIVAADPMIAALMGALVESVDFIPTFVAPAEWPEDAMLRVGPLAAILLEADHPLGGSDLFLARARRKRVPAMLFGSPASIERCLDWAHEHGVRAFALPGQLSGLQRALEDMPPRESG